MHPIGGKRARRRRRAIWLATAAAGLFPCARVALAQTWDGGGSDNLWSTPANWSPDGMPANNGSANIIMAGTQRLTSSVDPAYDVNSLTFDNTAGAFSLNTFDSSTLAVRGGGITNNSSATETFNIDVTAKTAAQNWKATAGPLVFNNTVTTSVDTHVQGPFPTTFSGSVRPGSGTLFIDSGTTAMFNGSVANSGTGLVQVNGTLFLNKSTPNVAIASAVAVGGTLKILSANQIADTASVLVGVGSNFDLNGFTETIGALSVYGGETYDAGNGVLTAGTLTYQQVTSTAAVIQGKINGVSSIPIGVHLSGTQTAPYNLDIQAEISGGDVTAGSFGMTMGNPLDIVQLSGNTSNTFGNLFMQRGVLLLAKSSGNAIPHDLTINDHLNSNSIVRYAASNQIGDTSNIILGTATAGGVLDLNGFSDTVGSVSGTTGSIKLAGGTLTTGSLSMNGMTVDMGTTGTLVTGPMTITLVSSPFLNGGTLNPQSTVTKTSNSTTTIATTSVLLTNPATTFNIPDGTATPDMIVSANFIGSGGLTKTGAGLLQLTGRQNFFTGPLEVNAGTLELKALGIRVLHVGNVSVAGGAKLDLSDNKLITTSPVGSATAGAYNGVSGSIQSGRNGGNWSGSGIVTSQTDATSSNLTSLGVATASQAKGIAATETAVFQGQTVSGSETLVMYTYGGDATLDGKINIDDYGRIDFNANLPGVGGWFNGDFNYDGKVNVDDYGIIDFNVGIQGAPFSSASSPLVGVASVPEPGAASAIMAMGLTLATRAPARRRRRSPSSP